jgi:hypothetical protein
MAVVLTYNSRSGLAQCLGSLECQVLAPGEIVVVDNASERRVDDLVASAPRARLVRQASNEGPAGGHATGLESFLEADPALQWAWVMDDDCAPEPSALARMLDAVAGNPDARLVFPRAVSLASDAPVSGVGWHGVLIARAVVEQVGVPLRELFWWAEDTEYLQWRIPRADFASTRVDDALVYVRTRRATRSKPVWKYYYEARGSTFYRLRVQRRGPLPLGANQLTVPVRLWRTSRSVVKLLGRALLVEHQGRVRKAMFVVRGAVDGAFGRLGPRVPVDDADRPAPP